MFDTNLQKENTTKGKQRVRNAEISTLQSCNESKRGSEFTQGSVALTFMKMTNDLQNNFDSPRDTLPSDLVSFVPKSPLLILAPRGSSFQTSEEGGGMQGSSL